MDRDESLEKERERRYESASAFAADVQRYLDDEPVQACPPSVLYRLRKLTRRYRAPLVTAGLLVFMLMAATAISVRYAYVAEAAYRESDKERIKTNDEKLNTEKAIIVAAEQRREADERRVQAEKLEADAVKQKILSNAISMWQTSAWLLSINVIQTLLGYTEN